MALRDEIILTCPDIAINNGQNIDYIEAPCTQQAKNKVKQWSQSSIDDFENLLGIRDDQIGFNGNIYLVPRYVDGGTFIDIIGTDNSNPEDTGCVSQRLRGQYFDARYAPMGYANVFKVCTNGPDGDITDDDMQYTVRHELLHAMPFRGCQTTSYELRRLSQLEL